MNIIKILLALGILTAISAVYAGYSLRDRAEAILTKHIKLGEFHEVSPCFVVDSRLERDVIYAVENEAGEVEFRNR